MKNNKKLIGLIAGLVCLAILMVLLLVKCGGATDPATTTAGTTAQTTTTAADTTASAETTDATEASTEATEETTEATSGGNSTPGGTGGYVPAPPATTEEATEPEVTEPAIEVAAPGTADNQYVETVKKVPGTFTTVKVPAGTTVYYTLYTPGSFLACNDEGVSFVYGGKTYTEGALAKLPATDEPIALQITNKAAAEKAFTLDVIDAEGSETNPKATEKLDQLKVTLTAGDKDGMFYGWVADATGNLKLNAQSVKPAGVEAEVIVTVGDDSFKLSEAADGVLSIPVTENEAVTVQVVAVPDANNNYPAAEVVLAAKVVTGIEKTVEQLPGSFDTETIAAGAEQEYSVTGINGMTLTIADEDAYIIYNGTTYGADLAGVVTVDIEPGDEAVSLKIGNSGTSDEAYTVDVTYPLGSKENPIAVDYLFMMPGSVTVPAGEEVYYAMSSWMFNGLVFNASGEGAYLVVDDQQIPAENGTASSQLAATSMNPILVGVGNSANQEKTFTLSATEPLGSMGNPEVVTDISTIEATTSASNWGEYNLTWTAADTGKLTLTLVDPATDVNYDIRLSGSLSNMYPAMSDVTGATSVSLDVFKGEEVSICLVASNVDMSVETANIKVEGTFTPAVINVAYNPMMVPAQLTVEPGQKIYYQMPQMLVNYDMSVSGADGVLMVNGAYTHCWDGTNVVSDTLKGSNAYMGAPVIAVWNKGDTQQTYVLSFSEPKGTEFNPEVVTDISYLEPTLISNGWVGSYTYLWTAPEAGTATFYLGYSDTVENADIQLIPSNSYAVPTLNADGVTDPLTGITTVSVDLAAGEELKIVVIGEDPTGAYSNASQPINGQFESGSQNYPYHLTATAMPFTADTVTIPAGATVWYEANSVSGTELTIYDDATVGVGGQTYTPVWGTVVAPMGEGMFWMPTSFSITNNAATDKVFTLNFQYPLGHMENPVEVYAGDPVEVELEAGDSDGYCFEFNAPADGTFKLMMDYNSDSWNVTVNNLTSYQYGDPMLSTEWNAVKSIEVSANDQIQIMVNTYDENDPWTAPGGKVLFNTSFVSGSGTQEDPYSILGTDVDIPVAAGQTVYCQGYLSGMIAGITGENITAVCAGNTVTDNWGYAQLEMTSANPRMPVEFTITNNGEDQSCNIVFTWPVGSMNNPADLYVGGTNTATVKANDFEGYHFKWEANSDGVLKIIVDDTTTYNWDLVVNNLTAYRYGDHMTSDEWITTQSITVSEGDEIEIVANTCLDTTTWQSPAGDVSFNASFVSGAGTQEDPYMILGTNVDISVPAGQTVYCTGYVSGMIANVYGEDVTVSNSGSSAAAAWGSASLEITGGDFFNPPVFTLKNTGTAETAYNVVFTYPVGSMENPEELYPGTEMTAEIKEGSQGYYYTWEAPFDGKIKVVVDYMNDSWHVTVNNPTAYIYGDPLTSEDFTTTQTVNVSAGDKIEVVVNTLDTANPWTAPEGKVTFEMSYIYGTGTQEDPYTIQGNNVDVEVPAGGTVYCTGRFSGMILSVNGGDCTIAHDGSTVDSAWGWAEMEITGGNMWQPPVFTLTNTGADAEYNLSFDYPLGSSMNPEEVYAGSPITATLEANDQDGYTYKFMAPADGTFKIIVDAANRNGWNVSANNITSGAYGDYLMSSDGSTTDTLTAKADDEIQIMVNTMGANFWETPAGEVTFEISFVSGSGTEEDPYNIQGTNVDIAVPAGQSVYCTGYLNGLVANVYGENVTVSCNGSSQAAQNGAAIVNMVSANPRMPVTFTLENTGAADASFNVIFTYPAGSVENPDQLVMGTNTVTRAAGDMEYNYTFTSDVAGTLTLTFSDTADWFYVVNNLTTYQYGDAQWSDSDPKQAVATVNVAAGDKIQIVVNTYDPNNMWSAPAGTVEFTAAFQAS